MIKRLATALAILGTLSTGGCYWHRHGGYGGGYGGGGPRGPYGGGGGGYVVGH